MLAGCASTKPPQITYEASVPPLPAIPAVVTDDRPKPIHAPPAWTVARSGETAGTATGRVEKANAAVRVQPRREGYFNAIQVYPWSEGALYQVYAAPSQITSIALEPGESLTGAGPIAAGDTARWIDPPPRRGPRRLLADGWPPRQRGRLVAERAVRTQRVEVTPPAFDDDLRLGEGVEDLAVKEFVAQPGIERLYEAVLPGAARRDIGGLRANRADLFLDSLRNELGAVI